MTQATVDKKEKKKNRRKSVDPEGLVASEVVSMKEDNNIHESSIDTESESAKGTEQQPTPDHFSERWSQFIHRIRITLLKGLLLIADKSAQNPKCCIISTIMLAIAVLGCGLFRGINVELERNRVWTPTGSKPAIHGKWLADESGFPPDNHWIIIDIHLWGENVLNKYGVERVFEALDVVRETPGYDELCAKTKPENGMMLGDGSSEVTCAISSISGFWNHSMAVFQNQVSTDEEAITALSATTFSDGSRVDGDVIFGIHQKNEDGILDLNQAYRTLIALPPIGTETNEFEKEATTRMLDLQQAWDDDPNNPFRLEVVGENSFNEEFARAIVKDVPLMPLVFGIMSILCCVFFANRDAVLSRSLLGFGALATIMLGMMYGYGFMFLLGIPFTTLTQILPFILFGVGLDDAFIIIGAYRRKGTIKDPVKRIHETIEDVGCSITLTTLTTGTAFALGCISDLPGVFNLCYYAISAIIFGFIVQMTFFIALIVIDEGRIQNNRRDCLVCLHAKSNRDEASLDPEEEIHFADRIMARYGDILMRKEIKGLVLCGFSALFGCLLWQATLLTQYFDFTDLVPRDSYIIPAMDARTTYFPGKGNVVPQVVFRFVDQSNETIQEQMESYVNDLVGLEQITKQPVFFWLRDFKSYVNSSEGLQQAPFETQIDAFLNVSTFNLLYSKNIVRDNNKTILASRLSVRMDEVDWAVVQEQTKALNDQRTVTEAQIINQDKEDWPFFTFDDLYYMWEFYDVAVSELKVTTIIGIFSVSLLSLLFVPHWSGFLFVSVLVCILYVDLLGVIHLSGLYINSVTYVGVLMSIGLMVDFTVHILLRYMESTASTREAKVKDTLQTMGASILLGGTSTLLGVLPLSFSTSEAFHTLFVIFIGLVTLGVGHGLILLPVVLSLIGPLPVDSTKEKAQTD